MHELESGTVDFEHQEQRIVGSVSGIGLPGVAEHPTEVFEQADEAMP